MGKDHKDKIENSPENYCDRIRTTRLCVDLDLLAGCCQGGGGAVGDEGGSTQVRWRLVRMIPMEHRLIWLQNAK